MAFAVIRPHRLVAQDVGFSVRKPGFDSPWGYMFKCTVFARSRKVQRERTLRLFLILVLRVVARHFGMLLHRNLQRRGEWFFHDLDVRSAGDIEHGTM